MQKGTIIGLLISVVILILVAGYLIYSSNYPVNYEPAVPDYTVAEVTERSCQVNSDCETPGEYLIRSNCPYESRCLENRCVVVCPTVPPVSEPENNNQPELKVSSDYFQNLKAALDSARDLNEKSYTLDYFDQNLSSLPAEALVKTGTKVLNISNNKIKSLSSEIQALKNLEEFYVEHNQLTGSLPAEIRHWQNLRVLDASDNQLTGVPGEIGQLKNLRAADFSNNELDTMPNEIANIADSLEVLNLSGNRYSAQQIKDIQNKIPKTKIIF